MSKGKKPAMAFSFAHLLGRAAKAEVDDKEQRADESDEDYAKRMAEEERKQGDDESDEDYAKRMEELDDNEDDDAADEEKEKAARQSERARCAAIFNCEAAGLRPDVAAHLAFTTDMSAADAISMLTTVATGKAAKAGGLASRMSTVNVPKVGADAVPGPAANSPQGIAAFVAAAAKKARGQL